MLYTVSNEEVKCEVFSVKASLVSEEGETILRLGDVRVLVPLSPENLSMEVIVGREILNKLILKLDGKRLEVL